VHFIKKCVKKLLLKLAAIRQIYANLIDTELINPMGLGERKREGVFLFSTRQVLLHLALAIKIAGSSADTRSEVRFTRAPRMPRNRASYNIRRRKKKKKKTKKKR